MTLEALGRQYAAEADNLSGLIASCNERRRAAMREGNRPEAHRQDKIAEQHAQQQKDLLEIAAHLRHYYDDSSEEQTQQTTMKGQWLHI